MGATLLRPFLFALLLLTAGCATGIPITLPADFVQLRGMRRELHATTADEAVLRVHDVDDPTEGSEAKFWIDTLRSDFVDQRGYVEAGAGEIADRDGVAGRWIEFTANVRGERVDYLAAVWMRPGGLFGLGRRYLQVVEFAARGPVYTARVEAVKKALSTVHD